MGKLILILGGARSGKSTTAEQRAHTLGGDEVLYIATAEASDDEMRARIQKHQAERSAQWRTVELPYHLVAGLAGVDLPRVVLLDCITLLASNLLLTLPDDCSQIEVNQVVFEEIDSLIELAKKGDSTWILVSNEVGMGVVPPYHLGRLYRDALGAANQRLAQAADEVILMVAGLPWSLKPG